MSSDLPIPILASEFFPEEEAPTTVRMKRLWWVAEAVEKGDEDSDAITSSEILALFV